MIFEKYFCRISTVGISKSLKGEVDPNSKFFDEFILNKYLNSLSMQLTKLTIPGTQLEPIFLFLLSPYLLAHRTKFFSLAFRKTQLTEFSHEESMVQISTAQSPSRSMVAQ